VAGRPEEERDLRVEDVHEQTFGERPPQRALPGKRRLPVGLAAQRADTEEQQVGGAEVAEGVVGELRGGDQGREPGGGRRSAFAARFTHMVREPAMQYVTRQRMQLAVNALRDDGATVAQLTDRLGYRSQAAFARAFKRVVGVAPGAIRRTPGDPIAARFRNRV
jgi:hypothetical protein